MAVSTGMNITTTGVLLRNADMTAADPSKTIRVRVIPVPLIRARNLVGPSSASVLNRAWPIISRADHGDQRRIGKSLNQFSTGVIEIVSLGTTENSRTKATSVASEMISMDHFSRAKPITDTADDQQSLPTSGIDQQPK